MLFTGAEEEEDMVLFQGVAAWLEGLLGKRGTQVCGRVAQPLPESRLRRRGCWCCDFFAHQLILDGEFFAIRGWSNSFEEGLSVKLHAFNHQIMARN